MGKSRLQVKSRGNRRADLLLPLLKKEEVLHNGRSKSCPPFSRLFTLLPRNILFAPKEMSKDKASSQHSCSYPEVLMRHPGMQIIAENSEPDYDHILHFMV